MAMLPIIAKDEIKLKGVFSMVRALYTEYNVAVRWHGGPEKQLDESAFTALQRLNYNSARDTTKHYRI